MIFKYKITIFLSVLVCCKCAFAGTGEIDCKNDCACCKNQNCGPGPYFSEGTCYDGCIDGYRGVRCYVKCTHACPKCDNDANVCESCYDGFYLENTRDCSGVCPSECVSCTSSTYCTKCKDEFYNDLGSTDCRYRKCPVNCKCDQNVCVECQAGYFGPSTTCVEPCHPNCNTCQSKDLCQLCKDGYYNGKKYDNSDNPVMNNCVHQCRAECTSCLSFNDCISCMSGSFGLTCQQQCATGCDNNVCEKETGNCNCKQNFAGADCTKCISGKYGDLCENNCSSYCKNKICDKNSGECNECINANVEGKMCDRCIDGWYGDNCDLRCPNNCKDNTCERNTGTCYYCKNNFDLPICEECVFGKYGKNCDNACPDSCANGICSQESGYCLSCTGNYEGKECKTCKEGFYGVKCDQNCSSNCLSGVCNRFDGNCKFGCKINYSGDKCCVNSENCLICETNTRCRQCKVGFYNRICNHVCPNNCAYSCDISTGICGSCKNHFYGDFCNSSCSSYCNNTLMKDIGICDSKTGHCLFGCIAGTFGGDCKASCSRLCKDNVCEQNTGRCSKGCNSQSREPECQSYTENQTQTDNNDNQTVILMGIIIAVLVLCLSVSLTLHWKSRYFQRNRDNKTISTETNMKKISDKHITSNENSIYNNVMETDSDSQIAIETENKDYEKINTLRVSEHEYGHITIGI